MHSIVLDSVHKVFRKSGFFFMHRNAAETYALRGVSLNVPRGEVLSILGPNGSGKSTTLKLISTVLLPDRGNVLVNGADTLRDAQQVRREVGFALASERSFFPRLTVHENLEFFAALENVSRAERAQRLQKVLDQVQLVEHAGKQVMKLSSGMYQRLGIARALIKQPRVLLLDEPTRSLDPAAARDLWMLIQELSNCRTTILLATHSFAEASACSHQIAILEKGRVLATRRTEGLSPEQLQKYYLHLTSEKATPSWTCEVPA